MRKTMKPGRHRMIKYMESAPCGIFVLNENAEVLEANQHAAMITGYRSDQLMTMSIKDLTPEESWESVEECFKRFKQSGMINDEWKVACQNGSVRWWTIHGVRLSENRYICFSTDITEKKETEARLLYLSHHDALTGLYDRRHFEEELKQLDVPDRLPLSIIMGDINGLKLINEAFGHQAGDTIIREAAKLILSCCRESDVLARTGGDEFSILLPRTDNGTAVRLLRTIQTACDQYNNKAHQEGRPISLSFGADTKIDPEEDLIRVFQKAEDYMNQRKLLEKKSSNSAIISSIKATMTEKSHETEEHAERLSRLSHRVGMLLNLSQIELNHLELLATLHDIGKVGVAEQILNKPGKLDEAEWAEMKKHPEIGYRIAMSSPNLASIAEYIRHHHERWDGCGYPHGLKGDDIPLLSRILAVADSFDAMTENRVYRRAMTQEKALEEIQKCAGTQFDPEIAEVFIESVLLPFGANADIIKR